MRDTGTNVGALELMSRPQGQRVVVCLTAMHERVGWSQKSTCSRRNYSACMQYEGFINYNARENFKSKRMLWIGSIHSVTHPSCSQSMRVSSTKCIVTVVGSDANAEGESSEMYEEEEIYLPERCPGCGVKLQLDDPDAPGYVLLVKMVLVAGRSTRLADNNDTLTRV